MDEQQYKTASKLQDEKRRIIRELKVWEEDLTSRIRLGYLQAWNNDHATKLDTNIPSELFNSFRSAAMNALKVRLSEIDKEFGEL